MNKTADSVAAALGDKSPRKPVIDPNDFVSTGCTLVNLGVSGLANGGFAKGRYYWVVGDSESGKSWLVLSIMAEATLNRNFKDYALIYDGPEFGALMDLRQYFGDALYKRIRPPKGTWTTPQHSRTVKEFFFNVRRRTNASPCIYVLDSMDALDTEEEEKKFAQEMNAKPSDDVAGSMGMQKAKANSGNIKRAVTALDDTGSILIVISQTRANPKSPFGGKISSGGHALRFYAHAQLWTSVAGDIKRTVQGKERIVGSNIRVDVEKNRITGWHGLVTCPFYRRFGFDDTGACVDWLVEEKYWVTTKAADENGTPKSKWGKKPKKAGGNITAPEFGFTGPREKLITHIEQDGPEGVLHALVQKVWDSIETACSVNRKPRYQ